MLDSKRSSNAENLANAQFSSDIPPKITHSIPRRPIKQIAKLTTAVVLAAIAIVLCANAFMLTKQ
jgi:multisubunit Na+/H+ antiporter MnhC subunit